MEAQCKARLSAGGAWLPARLTDELNALRCDAPAVVLDGENQPRQTAEVDALRVEPDFPPELFDQAIEAGYVILGKPGRTGL
jgi:hypothetical protein